MQILTILVGFRSIMKQVEEDVEKKKQADGVEVHVKALWNKALS